MLQFFPIPHEGENLYSVMARYSGYTGITNHSDLSTSVFGKISTRCGVLTPNKIDAFLENTQLGQYFSADDIIHKNTAFLPLAAFLTKSKRNQVYSMMRSSGDGASITVLLGANQMRTMRATMKYCPVCLAADLQNHREGYWRTVHQIPGIQVCPTHQVELLDGCPRCGEKHQIPQYSYHRLESHCTCGNSLASTDVKPSTNEQFICYAKDIEYIYQNRLSFNLTEVNDRILIRLRECGYIGGEAFKRQKLIDQFIRYFGEAYLKQIGAYPQKGDSNWIRRLFRKQSRCFVYYVLLIECLFGSIQEFQSYQPMQMSMFDVA